ncbi:hypothetical protein HB852_05095 [Listeria grandensis]|uniref:Ig-like domain-containing protein n=1 Tax=Listeria grandensis TaxID=1494963 RepID=UPI001629A04F|nr:Ig-like domain-containing protein [Listeria grandensis]MBC1473983.1 hypothetical protein [Listeria grandensis]
MKGTKKIVAFAVITGLVVAPYGGFSQLAKTPFGSIVAHADTHSDDVTNISPILTNTTKVTGKAKPGNTVYILSQYFTEGWTVADANGNFEITIGKQDVGKALDIVSSLNNSLNSGIPRTVELEKPTANPVLNGAGRITGNAYRGSNITVTVGGVEIGRTIAWLDETGYWRLDIADPSKLTVGSILQVKSQVGARVTTSNYTIGMSNPIPNTVTMNSTRVSGKGVAGATVHVRVAGREIGTGQVDSNGNLGATIPKQAVGTKLLLTQTKNGQTNVPVEVTVKNKLDPVTGISFITTDSTFLTGNGIPGTTVQVKAGTSVIGTAKVNDAGSFMVTIPKQAVNTKLAITQTQGTDTSDAVAANVVALYAGTPTLEEFYYSSTSSNFIKGTVPIGTTWVRLAVNGKFIDDFWRRDKTITPFSIDVSNVPELRETGATFTVMGIDSYYRYSEITTGVVESALTPAVSPYRAGQAYIRGTVGPEAARISVYTKAGVLIRNGQINNDRTFSIYVSGASDLQLAGNKVMVRATTADGKVSSSTELTVLP